MEKSREGVDSLGEWEGQKNLIEEMFEPKKGYYFLGKWSRGEGDRTGQDRKNKHLC